MSTSVGVTKGTFFSALRMALCLFVLALSVSIACATDELNWAFQSVGFTAGGIPGPQTAVAMRDGQVWPVVFSETGPMLQAYSLYPVANPSGFNTNTNWFQIGTNLIQDPGSLSMLSAATSPDGRFGAVLRKVGSTSSTAIVGASPSGFGGAMAGVQAIDFDNYGNLIKGTLSTIPTINGVIPGPLVDIATSPTGDIGAIDSTMRYYQKISMAGVWGYTDFKQLGLPSMLPDSLDLTIDSVGRPHVVGLTSSSPASIVAYDFDVPTGQWKKQTLATNMTTLPFGATIAADSRGRVGAAWVEPSSQSSPTVSLMYAYKDGGNDWVTQTIASSVTNGQTTIPLVPAQGVGLAFDAENLPVISFTSADGKIWVAYDPASPIGSVPEPSSLVLFAVGAMLMLFTAVKSGLRRQSR